MNRNECHFRGVCEGNLVDSSMPFQDHQPAARHRPLQLPCNVTRYMHHDTYSNSTFELKLVETPLEEVLIVRLSMVRCFNLSMRA